MTFPLTTWTAIKADDNPPAGWYWWRPLPTEPPCSPHIRYVYSQPYGAWTPMGVSPFSWSPEQGSFDGEWFGPIVPPS